MPIVIEQECKCCQYATEKMNQEIDGVQELKKNWGANRKKFEKIFWHCESCWNTRHTAGRIDGKSDFVSFKERFGEEVEKHD